MRAIGFSQAGGPEVLVPAELPEPVCGDDEVLIKVAAAGVNYPDVMQRKGRYPPPPGAPDILGLEVAGTVTVAGSNAAPWRVGDQVCALVAGGGYAEYCVAPAVQCLPVPRGFDMVHAAAIPETAFTVWTNLVQRGQLKAGETVLVHGGTSGIGTMAIQIARALGARVFATAGSDEKCDACRAMGADAAFNYREVDFVQAALDATDGRGVDVVLDIVGGDYLQRNVDCLALDGRLVMVGQMRGPKSQLNTTPVFRKRLTITASTLRARTVAEKGALAREVRAHVWPALESGQVRIVVHATFPLAQAADAHRMMESSSHVGKIVLIM
jgi:putative PIG3 family NAD(P)H quinone oxidoreductase